MINHYKFSDQLNHAVQKYLSECGYSGTFNIEYQTDLYTGSGSWGAYTKGEISVRGFFLNDRIYLGQTTINKTKPYTCNSQLPQVLNRDQEQFYPLHEVQPEYKHWQKYAVLRLDDVLWYIWFIIVLSLIVIVTHLKSRNPPLNYSYSQKNRIDFVDRLLLLWSLKGIIFGVLFPYVAPTQDEHRSGRAVVGTLVAVFPHAPSEPLCFTVS